MLNLNDFTNNPIESRKLYLEEKRSNSYALMRLRIREAIEIYNDEIIFLDVEIDKIKRNTVMKLK